MSGIDDMQAVNVYFTTQPINTPEAAKLKDAWRMWYDSLGYFALRSDQTYDEARNRKYAFNLANALTPDQKADVKEQQQHGLSSEELKGEPDRRLSDGTYAVPPPPLISTKAKIYITLAALIGGAGYIAKKIYVDPFISTFKR
jgi:hypothetical protein